MWGRGGVQSGLGLWGDLSQAGRAGPGRRAQRCREQACQSLPCGCTLSAALLQKYLDNYDLSIRVIYVLGTLGFSIGTAVMAMFANVYIAMIMVSTMGIVSMSISYCPYALLGQYHDIKEVRAWPWWAGAWGTRSRAGNAHQDGSSARLAAKPASFSTPF